MNWRNRIAGLLIALPAPVLAQTVTSENLIGTWARTFSLDSTIIAHDTLVFNANGTLKRMYVGNWPPPETVIRNFKWSLSADTLWMDYGLPKKPVKISFVMQLLDDGRKLKLQALMLDNSGKPKLQSSALWSDSSYTRVDVKKP